MFHGAVTSTGCLLLFWWCTRRRPHNAPEQLKLTAFNASNANNQYAQSTTLTRVLCSTRRQWRRLEAMQAVCCVDQKVSEYSLLGKFVDPNTITSILLDGAYRLVYQPLSEGSILKLLPVMTTIGSISALVSLGDYCSSRLAFANILSLSA